MDCVACRKEAKYSILLAPGVNNKPNETPRYYLPNQTAREHDHQEETWFCHPCMRFIEDNLRSAILYLQVENGAIVPRES